MSLKLIYTIYCQFLFSIFLIFPMEMECIICFSRVSQKQGYLRTMRTEPTFLGLCLYGNDANCTCSESLAGPGSPQRTLAMCCGLFSPAIFSFLALDAGFADPLRTLLSFAELKYCIWTWGYFLQSVS